MSKNKMTKTDTTKTHENTCKTKILTKSFLFLHVSILKFHENTKFSKIQIVKKLAKLKDEYSIFFMYAMVTVQHSPLVRTSLIRKMLLCLCMRIFSLPKMYIYIRCICVKTVPSLANTPAVYAKYILVLRVPPLLAFSLVRPFKNGNYWKEGRGAAKPPCNCIAVLYVHT